MRLDNDRCTCTYIPRNSGIYSKGLVDDFAEHASKRGITDLYLLEHTHQFIDFERMYRPGMLGIFKKHGVRILTASDAHEPGHAGINIVELQNRLEAEE